MKDWPVFAIIISTIVILLYLSHLCLSRIMTTHSRGDKIAATVSFVVLLTAVIFLVYGLCTQDHAVAVYQRRS
jgi:hypothetical protein